MARGERSAPAVEPEAGRWGGRSVAHRFVSPDGFTVLVGRRAADNDILTFELAAPHDFWLHVASGSGSHVVVRNPDRLDRLPRPTERYAAALAVTHSKARDGGRTAVHLTRRAEVHKHRGQPPGMVTLGRSRVIEVKPLPRADDAPSDGEAS